MSGKVLALEPYFGGSHKNFLTGLAGIVPGGMDLITLPARKWKWRMRLSGPWLANELSLVAKPEDYCCLLCSTFVDVASLKGLMPEWARKLPVCTYFHENQFAYPVRFEKEGDVQFPLTNVTTALASDRLAFNSLYNLETFLAGCRRLLKRANDNDMRLVNVEEELRAKSLIIHPGQDFSLIDQSITPGGKDKSPVIIWNHRWEHDKNPEQFFEALFELDRRQIDFKLVVMGESFRNQPAVFAEAREKLSHRILKFGYAESREEYGKWLRRGDVVLSTAGHEFFGISVIEAVRAGCRPLLPKRLSYPELFPVEYLYEDNELVDKLVETLGKGGLAATTAVGLTERFSWQAVGDKYEDWLFGQ
jgi:glycosyltransferase involved in cell wall biosynthesis